MICELGFGIKEWFSLESQYDKLINISYEKEFKAMHSEVDDRKDIFLEKKKRVSESLLWNLQSNYYEQQGINAWTGNIPFYITSNPFISKCYAQVIVRFVQDNIAQNPDAINHPFYVLELGTGSGKFSFYAIKDIHHMLEVLNLNVKLCYIMSDCTMKNIEYYQSHETLAPYIASGEIDFALFDISCEMPLKLIKKNKELTPADFVNPIVVLANYLLDTTADDFFNVDNGNISELLLSMHTTSDNVQNGMPKDLEKIKIEYSTEQLQNDDYYHDNEIDGILNFYKTELHDSCVSIPIGIINTLKRLRSLANNQLLFLATDKGYTSTSSLEYLRPPAMTFHGTGETFSLMVNFNALAQYFKNADGDYFLQTLHRGIKTNAFISGFKFKNLPKTKIALDKYFEDFSPCDFFNLHKVMSDQITEASLDTISAHLHLSDYDTHVYQKMSQRIVELIPSADEEQIKALADNMHKIAEHYYFMPKAECVLFEVGVFYHAIHEYENAMDYYKQSVKYIGADYAVHYNIGLCLAKLDRNVEALEEFKTALILHPESDETKEWIQYIEKILA